MVYRLDVQGTYNIRDLGGLPIVNGGMTRRHKFIRAGNLDQLPLSSQKQLIDYGVKTVIDLRDEWEVQQYPNVFAQSSDVTYRNLPLIGDHLTHSDAWEEKTKHYTELHELYCNYIDYCQTQIGAIMTTIAQSESTTIFHCYAGKDRTGIIACLLLGALGVSDHLIANDYSQSNHEITHLIEQWRDYAIQHGQDMQQHERDSASKTTTMLKTLTYIRQQYGTISNYFDNVTFKVQNAF